MQKEERTKTYRNTSQDGVFLEIPEDEIRAQAEKDGIINISVGAAIVHGSELLLVRRVPNDIFGGLYEFPGGSVRKKESIKEAFFREIREETGMKIKGILQLIPGFDYRTDKGDVRQVNAIVAVENATSVRLDPREHDRYAWIGENDVQSYPMSDNMKEIINTLFRIVSR